MGVEAYGVETDPNVRRIADHFGLKVHIGSIHDMPFPDRSFDLIVLNQVIEHVPDPLALLKVVKQRLAPNGRLRLSFPNTDSVQAARSGIRWINWHVPYHQHHFTRDSFGKLARLAGYEVLSVRTVTPNLWRELQARANAETPVEGQVSPNWSKAVKDTIPLSFGSRVQRAVVRRLVRLAGVFTIVENRAYDAIGRGDSLLVELCVSGQTKE